MKYAELDESGAIVGKFSHNQGGLVEVPDETPLGYVYDGDQWFDPKSEEKRVEAIKLKANSVIIARYPSWKQSNLTAQAVEAILNAFLSLPDNVFSQVQKQTLTDSILGLGAWDWVKQVRAESDRLESVPGATKDDGVWPD